jgi:hypothetical protein
MMGRTSGRNTIDEMESDYPLAPNTFVGECCWLSGPKLPWHTGKSGRPWSPTPVRARRVIGVAQKAAQLSGERVFVWNRHGEIVWTAPPPRWRPYRPRLLSDFYWEG